MRCYFLLLSLILSTADLLAQSGRPDMTFGVVTPESFAPHISGDSTPRAVYLFDKGVVTFEQGYSSTGGFSVVFKRQVRLLILHKSALSLSTITLSKYRKSDAMLQDIKGATYNLENGNVVATSLDKSNIFKDKNTNYDLQKIAFPNVKEGSIIEYSYTFIFPNIGFIPPWNFQGSYPELWSEFDISVPRLFDYAVMIQGYQKFAIDTVMTYDANSPGLGYGVSDRTFYANQTIRHVWAQADVPPLERAEPYTTTLKNHMSKVEFQLSAARRPNGYTETFSTTWPQVTHELLKNDHFGAALDDHNRWLDDELKKVTAGSSSPEEKLRRIYAYVRDHFTCATLERIYVSQPIKQTWEEKKGGCVADINLLLTAICRHEGLDASPVILSSRANGYAHDGYPLLNEYNYVITRVRLGGKDYLLDASKPYVGFGQLPELCYNGWGRAIDSTHDRIPLMADSIKESRRTLVVLTNTDSGYTGTYSRTAGVFESMGLRNQLKHIHPDEFFDNIKKSLPGDKQMGAAAFDSLDTPEVPVTWHYSMKYNFSQKRLYFNPILHERFNSSPFTSEERHYPVEMNYRIDNIYVLTMEIPKGYTVEQLPKPQRIMLSDSAGFFEYNISADDRSVSLRILLQLKKAVFPVDEYGGLRNFFSMISGKEKEPIIFKKTEQ
jgi:hypothetical protein